MRLCCRLPAVQLREVTPPTLPTPPPPLPSDQLLWEKVGRRRPLFFPSFFPPKWLLRGALDAPGDTELINGALTMTGGSLGSTVLGLQVTARGNPPPGVHGSGGYNCGEKKDKQATLGFTLLTPSELSWE